MAQGLTVVFDCNIYVTAAQAIGYSGSLADLEHIAPTLPFYRRKRAESLLWALKGGAGPVKFHVGWSNHIWKTVQHVLQHKYRWEIDDAVRFTDCVQMDLIDGTDGYVVDPVAEGFIRMDDHEDSSVYETARVLTDHPPVLLVADDMSFIQKVAYYHDHPQGATALITASTSRERRNTRERPRMGMRGMPHHPRPRLQRGPEHTRRGRACRVAKRARRQCKTPSRHGGTKQQSRKREPPAPQRCRNPDALAPGGSQPAIRWFPGGRIPWGD